VKDFADGWILCHSEEEARGLAADAGNLVEALYAAPASPSDAHVEVPGKPSIQAPDKTSGTES
jgi:hypothetical protein